MKIRRVDTFTVVSEMEVSEQIYMEDFDSSGRKAFEFETAVSEAEAFENFLDGFGSETTRTEWQSKVQLMDGDQVVAEKRVGRNG